MSGGMKTTHGTKHNTSFGLEKEHVCVRTQTIKNAIAGGLKENPGLGKGKRHLVRDDLCVCARVRLVVGLVHSTHGWTEISMLQRLKQSAM